MRVYICGVKERWSTERLVEEFSSRGHETEAVELDQTSLEINQGRFLYQGRELQIPDLVLVKRIGRGPMPGMNKRLNFLWWWEQHGAKVFSPTSALSIAFDRIQTNIMVSLLGIPTPETLITENVSRAIGFLREHGRVILRSPNTNEGRRGQEFKLADLDSFNFVLMELIKQNNLPFVIQEYLEEAVTAHHLVLLDGKFVGAYQQREIQQTWQEDIVLSDQIEIVQPRKEEIEAAEKIAQKMELFYADIEILVDRRGRYFFTDLDTYSGYEPVERVAGKPLTVMIADHLLAKVES